MKININFRVFIAIFIFIAIVASTTMSCYVRGDAQQDFKVIYSASLAHKMGLNPYDKQDASRAFHEAIALPYVYPPYTLFIFLPLTWLKFHAAAVVFLTVKLVAVCALLFLWNRIFDFSRHPILFLMLVAFAFNSALLVDLRAGNISVFEQFFIWIGFYCYTRDRIACFAGAIVLAAAFKFTPILLLGLLATRLRKYDFACLGFAGTFFLGLVAVNAVVWPQLFSAFVHNISKLGWERSECNPSIWALIFNVNDCFQLKMGWSSPNFVLVVIYFTISLIVISVAGLAFWRLKSLDEKQANLWRICLICFLYAMLIPRFKDYSYILLIAPAFYVLISRPLTGSLLPFCGLLMLLANRNSLLLDSDLKPLYAFQDDYYSFILAWILGGAFCYSILRQPQQSPLHVSPDAPGDKVQASVEKSAALPRPL